MDVEKITSYEKNGAMFLRIGRWYAFYALTEGKKIGTAIYDSNDQNESDCWKIIEKLHLDTMESRRVSFEESKTDEFLNMLGDKDWFDAHRYSTRENIENGEIGRLGNIRYFIAPADAKTL